MSTLQDLHRRRAELLRAHAAELAAVDEAIAEVLDGEGDAAPVVEIALVSEPRRPRRRPQGPVDEVTARRVGRELEARGMLPARSR